MPHVKPPLVDLDFLIHLSLYFEIFIKWHDAMCLLCPTIELIFDYLIVYHVSHLEPLKLSHVSRTIVCASKNVKFRLSRNSTKFDEVARFRETIPTVKSVLSSDEVVLTPQGPSVHISNIYILFTETHSFTFKSKI